MTLTTSQLVGDNSFNYFNSQNLPHKAHELTNVELCFFTVHFRKTGVRVVIGVKVVAP